MPAGSWVDAPPETYVLGIKALPNLPEDITQRHLYFAHVYKNQPDSDKTLSRYYRGGGTLLDVEYLVDCQKKQLLKRTGFWAGVCEAALSLLIWQLKINGHRPPFKIPKFYSNHGNLLKDIKHTLKRHPRVLIIGPNGMTGSGATWFFKQLSIEPDGWGKQQTQSMRSPFLEILDYDIMLNCILLDETTPLFLNEAALKKNNVLSVIADISCDTDLPHNPLQIYNKSTTFSHPTLRVGTNEKPIDIIAIDNITSFLPLEGSIGFSEDLFPYLCELLTVGEDLTYTPWEYSYKRFLNHKANHS